LIEADPAHHDDEPTARVVDRRATRQEHVVVAQQPVVKGTELPSGIDGKTIDAKQLKRLATLPSREQMLAELGAGMQSPMAAFAGALNGFLSMFVGALDALKSQREGA